MSEPKTEMPKITVSGVTFTAEEVVSAVVKIEGREIHITKKDEPDKQLGFKTT